MGLIWVNSVRFDSLVQIQCGWFCLHRFLGRRVLEQTKEICNLSIAWSRIGMYLLCSWKEHYVSRPCWRLCPDSSASRKPAPWAGMDFPTVVEFLILLNRFSVVNHLIERTAVSSHMLHYLGNMIYFTVWTVANAFSAFQRPAGMGFLTQPTDHYLWLDDELEGLRVLESRSKDIAPLERCIALAGSITPMHDIRAWAALLFDGIQRRMRNFVFCPTGFILICTVSYRLLPRIGPH